MCVCARYKKHCALQGFARILKCAAAKMEKCKNTVFLRVVSVMRAARTGTIDIDISWASGARQHQWRKMCAKMT